MTTATSSAHQRWGALSDVFDVAGAEGALAMLDGPLAGAAEFARSTLSARAVLSDAASDTLPALHARRDELAARIGAVNTDYESAADSVASASTQYWAAERDGPLSPAATTAGVARQAAQRVYANVLDDADTLRADVERFRRDLEAAEEDIADQLGRISGGMEVYGPGGAPVTVSQSSWGVVEAPYPGAPWAATVTVSLADRLRDTLSDAVADRIEWLSTADASKAADWMTGHPDFASAVGFVDPDRAPRLWEGLVAGSTPGAGSDDDAWVDGGLAQLLALAPLVIGNLNGIPATQKNTFNQAGLQQILADDDLDDETREKLETLLRLWERGEVSLLSLFLDTDGQPRASIAYGDVDSADQVTTVSHGIKADMGSLQGWAGSARAVREALNWELGLRASSATTAVVLFLEWDSGDELTVQGAQRPDAGAARLAQLMLGFERMNPGVQQNLALHSLGTTMGAQAMADHPGLVDNAWFFGSAGVTEEARGAVAGQIADHALSVRAAHASHDWIAPIGRLEGASEHPVDPRDIPGVTSFSAEGGFVAGYGAGTGEYGKPTEGHNAQNSSEMLFWGIDEWVSIPGGFPVPVYDTDSTGYLDPSSQSFKQTVIDLADGAETVGEPRP